MSKESILALVERLRDADRGEDSHICQRCGAKVSHELISWHGLLVCLPCEKILYRAAYPNAIPMQKETP